jgi:recombination associated protein RdgC
MTFPAEYIEQLTSLTKAKAFLGREFLTWLWFTAETTRDLLVLQVDGQSLEVDLWVDDRLVLEGTAAMSHRNVMKGGNPSHSREAAASLTTGKTVREMKLGLRIKDAGEYTAVLSCDDLNPRSLKLPAPETVDGTEGGAQAARALPLAERLQATTMFAGVLDALFACFLAQRVGTAWETSVLSDMREWIRQRQSKHESGSLH